MQPKKVFFVCKKKNQTQDFKGFLWLNGSSKQIEEIYPLLAEFVSDIPGFAFYKFSTIINRKHQRKEYSYLYSAK
jgi:hypothetical protein